MPAVIERDNAVPAEVNACRNVARAFHLDAACRRNLLACEMERALLGDQNEGGPVAIHEREVAGSCAGALGIDGKSAVERLDHYLAFVTRDAPAEQSRIHRRGRVTARHRQTLIRLRL